MDSNLAFIISLILGVAGIGVGITSIVLAIVAISTSKSAERESRENYQKTKDVLAEIDKRSAVIESTVTENQQQLLDTVTNLLQETAAPPKANMEEQFMGALMQTMLTDPAKGSEIMKGLMPFVEMSQRQESQNNNV